MLLVAAAVVLSWVTVRLVTRPLRVLSATARQVAAGNLDAHFVHGSSDEIGQLASTLETMKLDVRSQLEIIGNQADALREASLRITSARDESYTLELVGIHMVPGVDPFGTNHAAGQFRLDGTVWSVLP